MRSDRTDDEECTAPDDRFPFVVQGDETPIVLNVTFGDTMDLDVVIGEYGEAVRALLNRHTSTNTYAAPFNLPGIPGSSSTTLQISS